MRLSFVLASSLAVAASAAAQERPQPVTFTGGRVTVQVTDVAAADVLAAWARAGRVDVEGLQLVAGRVITLSLQDVSELDALQAILGDAVGFVATAKAEPGERVSRFARITIGGARTTLPPPGAHRPLEPEARYTYYTPAKWGPSLGPTSSPPEHLLPPPPETRFEYFTPAKAQGPKLVAPDVITIDPKQPAPETRFEYYVPAKIRK